MSNYQLTGPPVRPVPPHVAECVHRNLRAWQRCFFLRFFSPLLPEYMLLLRAPVLQLLVCPLQGWTNGNASLMIPNPDWYTTVLFKQLVGPRILNTSVAGNATTLDSVDAHFWCGNNGGVVLAWLNTGSVDVQASLPESLVRARAWQRPNSKKPRALPHVLAVCWSRFLVGRHVPERVRCALFSLADNRHVHRVHAHLGADRVIAGHHTGACECVAFASSVSSAVSRCTLSFCQPCPMCLLCVGVASQSAAMYLNGVLLSVDPVTGLLPQRPISGAPCGVPTGGLPMSAYTYGFYAFSGVGASLDACS